MSRSVQRTASQIKTNSTRRQLFFSDLQPLQQWMQPEKTIVWIFANSRLFQQTVIGADLLDCCSTSSYL